MTKIDQEKCIGCGQCAGNYSDIFQMGVDGKAEVINNVLDCPDDIIEECPVEAISKE